MILDTIVRSTVWTRLNFDRITWRDWRNVRTRRTKNCQYHLVGHLRALNILRPPSPSLSLLDSDDGCVSDELGSAGNSESGFKAEREAFPGSFGLDMYSSILIPLTFLIETSSCRSFSFSSSSSSPSKSGDFPFSKSAFSSLGRQHIDNGHLLLHVQTFA